MRSSGTEEHLYPEIFSGTEEQLYSEIFSRTEEQLSSEIFSGTEEQFTQHLTTHSQNKHEREESKPTDVGHQTTRHQTHSNICHT